jgi:hypothetical protein
VISEGAYALRLALTRRVPLVAACEQAQAGVPKAAASIAEKPGFLVSILGPPAV